MRVECPGCKNRYDVNPRPPGTRARCRCGTVFAMPSASPEPRMLTCPQCGGAQSGDGSQPRCAFCRAELLVKACPRCFQRVFHGSKHCSNCGCGVVEPAAAHRDGTAAQRQCPRCAVPLIARLIADVLFDECPTCTGVFVDVAALERLLSERKQARADAVLGAYDTAGDSALPPPPGPLYVKCPDCGALMNRRLFAQGAKAIVDTCKSHGTWFDAHELPRVVAFAMSGGIERSERAELEKQRESARSAMARAAALPSPPSRYIVNDADSWSVVVEFLAELLD